MRTHFKIFMRSHFSFISFFFISAMHHFSYADVCGGATVSEGMVVGGFSCSIYAFSGTPELSGYTFTTEVYRYNRAESDPYKWILKSDQGPYLHKSSCVQRNNNRMMAIGRGHKPGNRVSPSEDPAVSQIYFTLKSGCLLGANPSHGINALAISYTRDPQPDENGNRVYWRLQAHSSSEYAGTKKPKFVYIDSDDPKIKFAVYDQNLFYCVGKKDDPLCSIGSECTQSGEGICSIE